MNIRVIQSPAKINIGLNILENKSSNLHLIDTLMIPLSLHDTVQIRVLRNGTTNYITSDDFSLGDVQHNTAFRAIEAMRKAFDFKEYFTVFIHKSIPTSSGLGGGSSNAATVLFGVNSILKINASTEELIQIAKTVGSDVPFFLQNRPMRCRGIGEILTPINIKNDYYGLVVKPNEGCSTQMVYNKYDDIGGDHPDIDKICLDLENGDDDALAKDISNSLERAALYFCPTINEIKQKLLDYGFKVVFMSGSGSSVVALSTDKKYVKKALEYFSSSPYFVEMVKLIK